jgi:hypothetical protein
VNGWGEKRIKKIIKKKKRFFPIPSSKIQHPISLYSSSVRFFFFFSTKIDVDDGRYNKNIIRR